ncbi:hypothetical protein F183_A28770 [Bryobacterales bacterium F-183]|nr:hypothetical protein F183_A28770 [Bryobacterales bacterium F-183]
MRPCTLRLLWTLSAISLSAVAPAQTSPFTISVQQTGSPLVIGNGETVNITAADIGASAAVVFTITYQGETAVVVQDPALFGSTQFAISQSPGATRLNPGQSLTVTVVYRPVSSALSSARLTLGYVEQTQNQAAPVSAALSFILTGVTPEVTLSYVAAGTGNNIAVLDRGAITLPDTLVNGTSNTTVSLTNRGSAPASVSGVSLTGSSGIILTGLPLFPLTLAAGQQLSFGLRYSPMEPGPTSSVLSVQLGPQRTLLANVSGVGVVSAFTYRISEGATPSLVKPGEPIVIAETNVGGQSTFVVTAINGSSVEGTISSLAISGSGFQLLDVPQLPQGVRPNGNVTFTVAFAPTVAGDIRGTLRVGNDTFPLLGRALGSRLTFSYTLANNTFALQPAGAILFPPVAVGQRSSAVVRVQNAGTARALLSSITLADPRARFSLSGLPPLIAALEPGEQIAFTVTYEPVTVGNASTNLLVDTASFTVSGSSTEPPALPVYTIRMLDESASAPLQQRALTVTLAEPYPLALTGILTMTASTVDSFPADPAAVFSNGTRTAVFSIPAGQREAVFAGAAPVMRFQTGTIASGLSFAATFATAAGGVDITPGAVVLFVVTVPSVSPRIVGLQVTGVTASGLTISVTGYATTRTLTTMSVRFEALPDIQVSSSQFDIPVSAVMSTYFASASGQAAGGQFLLSLPFLFRTASGTPLPSQLFSAVEVTLTNPTGTSTAVRAAILPGT